MSTPFSIIPNHIIKDPRLNDGRKITLIAIIMHQGKNSSMWASYKAIADYRNATISTISKHVKWLEKNKYIEVQRREGTTSKIRFIPPENNQHTEQIGPEIGKLPPENLDGVVDDFPGGARNISRGGAENFPGGGGNISGGKNNNKKKIEKQQQKQLVADAVNNFSKEDIGKCISDLGTLGIAVDKLTNISKDDLVKMTPLIVDRFKSTNDVKNPTGYALTLFNDEFLKLQAENVAKQREEATAAASRREQYTQWQHKWNSMSELYYRSKRVIGFGPAYLTVEDGDDRIDIPTKNVDYQLLEAK